MASFHNWTGDEEIDTQVPQFLNEDNAATQEKLDTKFNKSLDIAEASDLNNFKDEGLYCCNSNSRAETILNCPTNYAFGLMVWGKGEIVYQEVREYNRSSKNQDYNNCWRRSYSESGQGVWSNWQKVAYAATTLAGYGITDGMSKNATNSVSATDILKRNVNTSYLRLTGGDTFNKSATLQLYGGIHTTNAGQFLLNAADSTHSAVLSGSPSGILKWNNKNIVRSVNNSVADDDGNVNVTNMAGASDSAAGKAGLVPAPAAGMQDMALCGDATFKVLPIAGGGTGADNAKVARENLGLAMVASSGDYNDLSNKPSIPANPKAYIVETYRNGTEWYRVWSDGWIEQGGYFEKKRDTALIITFLKPYADENYTLTDMLARYNGSMPKLATKTTTAFSMVTNSWDYDMYWRAEGKGV